MDPFTSFSAFWQLCVLCLKREEAEKSQEKKKDDKEEKKRLEAEKKEQKEREKKEQDSRKKFKVGEKDLKDARIL